MPPLLTQFSFRAYSIFLGLLFGCFVLGVLLVVVVYFPIALRQAHIIYFPNGLEFTM